MFNVKQYLYNNAFSEESKRQYLRRVLHAISAREQRLHEDQRFSPQQADDLRESLRLLGDEEELFGEEEINLIADTYEELTTHVNDKELENQLADFMNIDDEEQNVPGPVF